MIIDVHGHYTTAPPALGAWRDRQIAALNDLARSPKPSDLRISDDELRESIETNQLAKMRERGSDLTIFSPRASFMAHHIGGFETSTAWAGICNELIHRICTLFPQHFMGAAMLPQSPGVDPATCIPELERPGNSNDCHQTASSAAVTPSSAATYEVAHEGDSYHKEWQGQQERERGRHRCPPRRPLEAEVLEHGALRKSS